MVAGLGEHHLGLLVALGVASLHLAVKKVSQVPLIGHQMVLGGGLHVAAASPAPSRRELARMVGGWCGRRGLLMDDGGLLLLFGVEDDQGGSLVPP